MCKIYWAIVNGGYADGNFSHNNLKISIIDWHLLNEFIWFISSLIILDWYPLKELNKSILLRGVSIVNEEMKYMSPF